MPADDLRARLVEVIKSVRIRPKLDGAVTAMIMAGTGFHITDEEAAPLADAVLAALLEDPGDLPKRMATEMRAHSVDEERGIEDYCACGIQVGDWDAHLAEAMMSVRWEQAAHLAGRAAKAVRDAEVAEDARDEMFAKKCAALNRAVAAERERDRYCEATGIWTHEAYEQRARAEAAEAQVAALQRELAQMRAERDSVTGIGYAAESKRVALEAALDEVAPGEAERVQAAVSQRLVDQMCAGLPSRPDDPEEIRRLADSTETET